MRSWLHSVKIRTTIEIGRAAQAAPASSPPVAQVRAAASAAAAVRAVSAAAAHRADGESDDGAVLVCGCHFPGELFDRLWRWLGRSALAGADRRCGGRRQYHWREPGAVAGCEGRQAAVGVGR